MVLLSKNELLARVLSAIRAGGWLPLIGPSVHPFDVCAVRGSERTHLRIYIWNVTSGGPSGVRPEGELRIQLTGVGTALDIPPDRVTLLLGWAGETGHFFAFDYARHLSFGRSVSIQIPPGLPIALEQRPLAIGYRANQEIVVGFRPRELMDYVTTQRKFHGLEDPAPGLQKIDEAFKTADDPEPVAPPATPREQDVTVLRRWVRDSRFRERVMIAYEARCTVCGLDVGLPDAAHIVPVSIEDSTDETSNGLALCPTHHAAYDRALLGIRPDYRVFVPPPCARSCG